MSQTLVNGQDLTIVDVSDRGLLYGDGFFSTLRVRNNKVEHWPLHAERIRSSQLKLNFPTIGTKQLEQEVAELIAAQPEEDGVIRLTITRGSGSRGYRAPDSPQIQRILSWGALPQDIEHSQQHGVEIGLCETSDSINTALAGIKHLNRLPQVLAQNEIIAPCFDGIMLANQRIVGGSKTNIYFYQNGEWLTPQVDESGVDGTVRRWLLGTQAHVKEAVFGLDILSDAQYCMVSNALYGMIPVTKILQHHYEISPEVAALQQQYRDSALR
ncbi:aminodeoxychorismate lyase [Kangiella taiwanensis]|uniref:Aminodeoxychorismate lyase n=1 Tax=Kangiella taiwanensis TaxID=1079179 RepID=A0ABP8I7T1_9GAMM|nr:aminodeoxychorismate lyase [Kangiella taiwanensis]